MEPMPLDSSQKLAEIFSETVIPCNENGNPAAVDCSRLVARLAEVVMEQQQQINNQDHSLKEHKAQLARLRSDIERLRSMIRAATMR